MLVHYLHYHHPERLRLGFLTYSIFNPHGSRLTLETLSPLSSYSTTDSHVAWRLHPTPHPNVFLRLNKINAVQGLRFHSKVVEGFGLLGRDAASLDKWFLTVFEPLNPGRLRLQFPSQEPLPIYAVSHTRKPESQMKYYLQ
jgi:hypothetical protein